MTISVRRGIPADAALLATLAARTFEDTFAASNTADDMSRFLIEAYGVRQQCAELLDPDITTLLAEVDGAVAGYAQVRGGQTPDCVPGPAPVELWRFYIDRPWHGRGVAQALMIAVENEASRRQARTLWLGVWEHNERAKAFYAKYGFTDVGAHVFQLGDDAQIDRILVRPLTASGEAVGAPIAIVPFHRGLAEAFADLNRAWIEKLFRLEESDLKVLRDPETAILNRGGQIFFAMNGDRPVGTVADIRVSPTTYELAKMAVDPSQQGRGIGEQLGRAAIEWAKGAGCELLYLETNSALANAIRLYERLGFAHAPFPTASPYARADVYMEIRFPARPLERDLS